VATAGELQSGAHGLAAPVPGVLAVEASVGVVALQALDSADTRAAVLAAARAVARSLAGPVEAG
jgi:DNA-binding IclR family transcriptional regulator